MSYFAYRIQRRICYKKKNKINDNKNHTYTCMSYKQNWYFHSKSIFLKFYAYRQYGPELPSIHLYPDPQELEDSKTSQPVVALLIFTGRERYVMITMIFFRSWWFENMTAKQVKFGHTDNTIHIKVNFFPNLGFIFFENINFLYS